MKLRKILSSIFSSYKAIFFGLAIAGLTVVLLGGIQNMPWVTSIGGALLGTSMGSFVSRFSNEGFEEDLRSLVREGVQDSFVSDEEKLKGSRTAWHMYHVTEMRGEVIWSHTIIDFTKSKTPGRLTSETGLLDEDEEAQPYTVEAGRRDERFIVFLRSPISEESAATYIFPYMGFTSFSLHYGVSFLETWDGTRAITPAILSRKVLHDHEGKLLSQKVVHDHEGNQPGQDHEAKLGTLHPETARSLDRLWRREIYRLCSFFPEAGATTRSASLG